MESRFQFYRSNRVHYYTCGEGEPLFLIHGYQADSRIWERVIPFLEKKYQLFIPDLPGHGQSPLIQPTNTMSFLAEIIFNIMLSQGFKGISIAGHSMGGYVALAFAARYMSMVDELTLINSHPFEDTMTKILARNREADLIADGRKELLLRSFVANNFSKSNQPKLHNQIDLATKISLSQPDKGMLADLAGMMARFDMTSLIQKARFKTNIILGSDDLKIDRECFKNLKAKKVEIHTIEDCGHISILEKPAEVAAIINQES